MRQQLERDNANRPELLEQVPREKWPRQDGNQVEIWLSRKYMVQVFDDFESQRLSINRTTAREDGRWDEGLTWDELQDVKRQVGRGDLWAVEMYPADAHVVNVANMRHLWVLAAPPRIGWFKTPNVEVSEQPKAVRSTAGLGDEREKG